MASRVRRRLSFRPMRIQLMALGLLLASSARAEDRRLTHLERQLALASASPVRARAAAELAALDEDDAVGPLCKALGGDADPRVRTQAATSLGNLGGSAADLCLRQNRQQPLPQVRAAVAGALESLRSPREGPARRYVALLPLDGAHNALGAEAGAMALRHLQRVLERRGVQVGGIGGSPSQIQAMLKKRKLPGFALKLALGKIPNGVSLDLLCSHYPTGGLIGDVTVKASGADIPDLIRALVPRAVDEAQSTCGWRIDD